jgi:hypothetical protein
MSAPRLPRQTNPTSIKFALDHMLRLERWYFFEKLDSDVGRPGQVLS